MTPEDIPIRLKQGNLRALITGASSGIGEATAWEFVRQGVTVVLVSEQEKALISVAQSLCAAGGQASAMVVDLAQPEQVVGLIARAESESGPLDILVNNAGIGMSASILETRQSDLRHLFEVNFFALAELSRQALAVMAPRGKGRILNVSSAAGCFGSPTISAYSATKGAVHTFTQALRIEAREYGVLVGEVLPISVQTRFFDSVKGEKYRPQGRVLTAETVARSIVRNALSRRLRAEILPYPALRIVFVLNAMWPDLLARLAHWQYARSLRNAS